MSVYFGEIVPIGVLIVLNCLLIYKSTRFNGTIAHQTACKQKSIKRKTEMTRTILLVTFIYAALVLPTSIVDEYFYSDIIDLDIGQMIICLICVIQFSYSSLNFFLLFFSNKLFAFEVKQLFSFLTKRSGFLNRSSDVKNSWCFDLNFYF